ncbi:MAG: gamma-glutamyltransferase [Mariprofundaceae bacterium]
MRLGLSACVAAGHTATAEAGAEILRAGGNAVDAAIAAACMSFIAEPVLTGAGGGGFMLVRQSNGASTLLDGFARMPEKRIQDVSQADFRAVPIDFGDTTQTFHVGQASVATPGLLPLLFHAHKRFGRIPVREVMSPAMQAARDGLALNALQASFIHLLKPILTSSENCRTLHSREKNLLNAGELFRNPDLANLLELLAIEGMDEMHRGDIAKHIVAATQSGGLLTMQDMAKTQVMERTPLRCATLNGTLLTNPPPSSGGTLIAFSLLLLEKLRASRRESHAVLLAACLAKAATTRNADFDTQLQQSGFADAFLHPDKIKQHLNRASQSLDEKNIFTAEEPANRHGSTTHISALDSDGMAVSMTASNGEGSGVVVPGTGIHLNNMLGEEDINPLGFHCLSGGKTLPSMMAPSIFEQHGRPALILGSGGSNRLRGAIVQVLLRHVVNGMTIADAVCAARIHNEHNILDAEPDALLSVDEKALRRLGWSINHWSQRSVYFGGVHAIAVESDGRVQAAGDPRRGGAVAWA